MREVPRGARLLVIRTGALGDVVNALAFAHVAKRARPDLSLGWVVHDLAHPIVEGHPLVDRVHLWRRGGGWAGWRAIVGELRDSRYDVAVDMQRILKGAVLARATRAARTVGYDRARSKELCWLLHRERIAAGPARVSMARHFLEFAAHLGFVALGDASFDALERPLPERPAAAQRAAELLAGLDAPIAVNVGASGPERRWPPERLASLSRGLAERGRPVVVVGGPSDRAWMGAALAGLGTARDLVGHTDVRALIEVLRRSSLYVGGDTGPMHIAAALGVRCIALYGPSDAARTGPAGPTRDGRPHVVLQAPSRRMEDLSLDEVLAQVLA